MEKTIAGVQNQLGKNIMNDQHVFNKVYKGILGLQVTMLPRNEYPNGDIYFNRGLKSEAKMVHNNWLHTTAEKVERFKEVGLWDDSDSAFLKVHEYSI
jgi:hypothetical protein